MLAGEIPGNHALRRYSHRKGQGRAVVLLVVALVVGACSERGGAPDPATSQGEDVLDLWRILLGAGVALGVLVTALILWSVVRYRRPRDAGPADLPKQTGANIPIEVFYTVVPLVIVAVLFSLTMRTQNRISREGDNPELTVE